MSCSSIVEDHPQRKYIIDALLAGESVREVAAKCVPSVSHGSIHRYKQRVLKPAMTIARNTLAKAEAKSISSNQLAPTIDETRVEANARHKALRVDERVSALASPLIARLRERDRRREDWMRLCEEKESISGFVAVQQDEFRDIELEAKLTGALQDPGSGGIQIQIVCPTAGVQAAQDSDEYDGATYDVSADIVTG